MHQSLGWRLLHHSMHKWRIRFSFHLLPLKILAFCFETICGYCITERRTLQILILIFSSISLFVMLLCTRSWNSNPHPFLTLSYWASVFWRVLIYILAFSLRGTSSTIHIWTTSYASLNTNKNDNCVSSTSWYLFFPADLWNKTKALY